MATDPNALLATLLGTVGQQGGILQNAQTQAAQGQQFDDQHALAGQQQQLNDQQIAQGRQTASDQQAYQGDISNWIAQGAHADGLSNLIAKYPKQYQALQDSWKAKNADAAQSDLRAFGSVFNALDNGSTDVALGELKARRAAEVKAGIPTDELDQHIGEIESGNPQAINAVKGWARAQIAGAAGAAGDANLAKSVGVDVDSDRYKAISGKGVFDTRTGQYVANPEGGDPASVVAGGGGSASGGDPNGPYNRASIRGSESNGNDAATNPHSSAAGRYQIEAGPALRLMVQNPDKFPEMQGKSAAERRDFAKKPDVQERMMDILEPQYRSALAGIGAPQTGGNMYMMHFLGTSTGPKFLQAGDGADAQATIRKLDPKNASAIISGNGAIFKPGNTVGDVRADIGRRYAAAAGGGSGGDGFSKPSAGAPGTIAPLRGVGDYSAAAIDSMARLDKPPAGIPKDVRAAVFNRKAILDAAKTDDSSTGPAYVATLTPGRASLLAAINDGRAPAPKPGSRFGQALSEDLARAYPNVDETQFAVKQKVRQDFTGNGKAAQALASYNRFAAHLNSAWAIHQRLGGPNLGPASGLAAGAIQAFSPKDVNAYNTEIDGIQGEFQKLTKLGVANEGEANRLIHNARAAQSSDGRAGALEAMASLVAGAYQPQVSQWRSAFPDKALPVDVSPGAKSVINNVIHGGRSALPTGANGAPRGNAAGFTPTGTTARAPRQFRVLGTSPIGAAR